MRPLQILMGHIVLTMLLGVVTFGQSSDSEIHHFIKDGIAFDYPTGWTLTDRSTQQAQQLILAKNRGSAEIVVTVQRRRIMRDQLAGAQQTITEPLVQEMAQKFGVAEELLERAATHIEVAGLEAKGIRLRASSGGRPGTGEVFSLRLGLRFVNLVFYRADADEPQATPAWTTILASLKVDAPVIGKMAEQQPSSEDPGDHLEGGVLNGRALALPLPPYPTIARAAHASGTVEVQILIDEQGNVVSARAISGHPLLQAAAVQAARQAKFSPTLLEDQPVKVTGVIQYNFIAQ